MSIWQWVILGQVNFLILAILAYVVQHLRDEVSRFVLFVLLLYVIFRIIRLDRSGLLWELDSKSLQLGGYAEPVPWYGEGGPNGAD